MNQAYLIIAYRHPQQLAMLLEQLHNPLSFFFIHIDAKSNLQDFVNETKKFQNLVFLKERHVLNWGGFGIIKATIALMKELRASRINYSHAHLLSGEDISLKRPVQIETFFSNNIDVNYLEYFELPDSRLHKRGLNRVKRYYFGENNKYEGKTKLFMLKVISLLVNDVLVKMLPIFKKRLRKQWKFFAGSGWWSLNRKTINWLVSFFEKEVQLLSFFETVFIPDECAIHTVLLNSEYRATICNNNKRFIDWHKSKDGSPKVLQEEDFLKIKNSDYFFARKVDFENGKNLYKRFIE